MKQLTKYGVRAFYSAGIFLTANTVLAGVLWPEMGGLWRTTAAAVFLLANLLPSFANRSLPTSRLRRCGNGCELLTLFLISATASVLFTLYGAKRMFDESFWLFFWQILTAFLAEAAVFWNGMVRIYLSSFQLGAKWRVIGALCGWIPVVNLLVLIRLIRIVREETDFESMRILRNRERKEERLCATRYPILMVHGVFSGITNTLTTGAGFRKSWKKTGLSSITEITSQLHRWLTAAGSF